MYMYCRALTSPVSQKFEKMCFHREANVSRIHLSANDSQLTLAASSSKWKRWWHGDPDVPGLQSHTVRAGSHLSSSLRSLQVDFVPQA